MPHRMASTIPCIVLLFLVSLCGAVPSWYTHQRREFIRDEDSRRLGSELILTSKEELVNNFLMLLKHSEFSKAVYTHTPYTAAGHFFEVREKIEASTIYKIIQKMPKGAVLHVHSHAMVSLKWVIKNLTYLPNLYSKKLNGQAREYIFADTQPGADWVLVSELRKNSNNTELFDAMLEKELTINTPDPDDAYPSINDVWGTFNNYFRTMGGFWDSDTVNEMYFRQALKEFYDDGIQYMEIRGGPYEDFVKLMMRLVDEFRKDHPDFIGIKHITTGARYYTHARLEERMESAVRLMKAYPDLVKGFDLVAQEDTLNTQRYYLDQLLDPKNNFSMPYFFHAGETDWTQAKDQNLVDSVLLNVSRIGHGYALLRHPKVMERVRNKQIAVELNPISNQVLGLVSDLRNHPGAIHLANDDPVVISSDDPPCWYASPLSHDFYMAFMALGSVSDDLRLMKQLAINSFKYSAMTDPEKEAALRVLGERWYKFIDDIIEEFKLMDFL